MAKNPTSQLLEALGPGPTGEGLFGELTAPMLAAARASVDDEEPTDPDMSAPDPDGKRSIGRVRFRGDVEIRTNLSGGARRDRARDISDEGIFVETAEPLEIGDPVVITLSTAVGPVQLNGRVRWVTAFGRFDDPTPGMGIEFVGLDETKRARLSTILAKPEDD